MSKTGGGAATAGGMDFQNRVAAWVAVHVLAEIGVTLPLGLSSGTTLDWIRCETEQPVDDLLAGTSNNGLVFAQMKRNLSLSKSVDSDLASALDQFVRQYVSCLNHKSGKQFWERPLDPTKDRLVLITSSNSSKPICQHLPNLLNRLRNLLPSHSLSDAAINENERNALKVIKTHLERSWIRVSGISPSDDDLQQLLCLIRVQVLDPEVGDVGEREAMNILSSHVIQEPADSEKAWSILVCFCTSLAKDQSGADRSSIQETLLKAGVELNAPQSYQNDIKKLNQYSATILDALTDLSIIQVGINAIKIKRLSSEALNQVAVNDSILVVGEPGSGKSGALHDFASDRKECGSDCVLFAVDRIAAHSLAELRNELNLDHELLDVLDNWIGKEPAYFIIDALDAAREESAGTMIRDIIGQLTHKGGRWKIVASIRKFDLRYGYEIKKLFAGSPPTQFKDAEFENIRHLNIPHFSDDELNQVATQSDKLDSLVKNAPPELKDLLRVPFNLRCMADLIGVGVATAMLSPIRTQLELLDHYWTHRIIRQDGMRDAREGLLRHMCQLMVKERMLHVDREKAVDNSKSADIHSLLTCQVIVEWQPSPDALPDQYILSFSHHVLFDYAVSRLLLRGTPELSVRYLADETDRMIFVLPSLIIHFRHLWTQDTNHLRFWNFVFQVIRSDEIPEIGKIIGLSVVAGLTKKISDLEPLCEALVNSSNQDQKTAEQALRHLVGSLLASPPDDSPLIGPDAGPWCNLLELVSTSLRQEVAYFVRILLATMCEHPEHFTFDQRSMAGHSARCLLKYAWAQSNRDVYMVIHAIQCVCRTFESDPITSAALIRCCLVPHHFAQYAFEEMPWLAREVNRLIHLDQILTEEIYKAAFSHQETSNEQTKIGSSQILPLSSNRRQDYNMALYELAEVFPSFLDHAPENATRALIAAMEAYVAQRHSTISDGKNDETFDFDDQPVRLLSDYSSIWDECDTHRSDEQLKMLDAFQQYLENLAELPSATKKLQNIIILLTTENRLAVLWRRLLLVGTCYPEQVGKQILPLAWAIPILTGYDTKTAIGDFLKVIFQTLKENEREQIEQAILAIPKSVPSDQRDAGERVRDRLLGCLDDQSIITNDARGILEELRRKNAIPSNDPNVRSGETTWGPYGEEECLADEGVPVYAEANRKIRELERPVKEFADEHINSTPSMEEVSHICPSLHSLYEALSHAKEDGVHEKQCVYAWDYLAAACSCAVRSAEFSCENAEDVFLEMVLLEASQYPVPVADPETDAHFDNHVSWGRPAPRIEAAEGLITLASHLSYARSDVLMAIERLSYDPVPAVRFQIARYLNALYEIEQKLMWNIIEEICHKERCYGVLQGLLSGTFQRIAESNPDRIVGLTKSIFDRVTESPGSKAVREFCIKIFVRHYILSDHAQSRAIILNIAKSPITYPDEASHILSQFNETLTYGPIFPPDSEQNAIRTRAIGLLDQILQSSNIGKLEIEQNNKGIESINTWPQDFLEKYNSLVLLIDKVGREIYFASGSSDKNGQGLTQFDQSHKYKRAERFYRETTPILEGLIEVNIPHTMHHLLQTLEFLVPIDPCGVFLRIGRVICAGQQGGYQYESLGANLIVGLVERYLAEYRELLRKDEKCRQTLIDILDVFVNVGWPSARRLTYRLGEIFR